MRVLPEEIPEVARLVNQLCGVILDGTKGYLIESRLSGLAEAAGCATFAEFCRKVRSSTDRSLATKVIDAITTQETLFFRDASPFEALAHKVIPDLIDSKAGSLFPKRIRVWSAACSTGQEPYSIAMVFHELLPDVHSWDIQILATDISDAAIQRASAGLFPRHEIQRGMKPQMLSKYFREGPAGWKVRDELRGMIAFQRLNLLEPFPTLGPFDVIFCRNVAIYFDPPSRRSLFMRLADRLTPEGTMFVGSAESLADLGPQFLPLHHCRTVFYQPRRRGVAAMARTA